MHDMEKKKLPIPKIIENFKTEMEYYSNEGRFAMKRNITACHRKVNRIKPI